MGRDAAGAEGWSLGRVCRFPIRGGTWGGGCTPSPENFLTFWLKIVPFGVYSDKNSHFGIE